MNMGTVEYRDTILWITDIFIRDGAFVVIASGFGPSEEYNGPVLVYGPDGLILQYGGKLHFPAAVRKQAITIHLVMTPSSPEAEAA